MKLIYTFVFLIGLIVFATYSTRQKDNISNVRATATAFCYNKLVDAGLVEATDVYEIELNKCINSGGAYIVPQALIESYMHRDLALNLISEIPMDCSKGLCKEIDVAGGKQNSDEAELHLEMANDFMKKYWAENPKPAD